MATQVGRGLVLHQQGAQSFEQTVRGAMFRDGPDRIVSGHQQEVGLGPGHAVLQPQQLPVGLDTTRRSIWLPVLEIIRVPTQQHRIQHQNGQGAVRLWDAEVQLIIIVWEVPDKDKAEAGQESPLIKTRSGLKAHTLLFPGSIFQNQFLYEIQDCSTCIMQSRQKRHSFCFFSFRAMFDQYSPSRGHLAVLDLGENVSCMVMVARNNKPWNIKRLCGVDPLESFLQTPDAG